MGSKISHVQYSPNYLSRIKQHNSSGKNLPKLLQSIEIYGYQSNGKQGVVPLGDFDKELWETYQLYFLQETLEQQQKLLNSKPVKVVFHKSSEDKLIGSLFEDDFKLNLYLMGYGKASKETVISHSWFNSVQSFIPRT